MKWLKQQLRQSLQAKRRQLSPSLQLNYSKRIAHLLFQQSYFRQAQNIALYFAFAGEVSTTLILKQALALHKTCYLPVLTDRHLKFVNVDLATPLTKNKFGILEPTPPFTKIIAPQALDLVLVPLVAFDLKGHRLGMGKGYYDVTFAFKHSFTKPSAGKPLGGKPRLVGLAYDFQRINNVPRANFDVLLDEIVTENTVYSIS
ncbi:MAG: 5-formyltetrahydrofolate cyclo-ligase [Candidatus Berkiellales bacterium]